jgi:formylglycine-generating enzyme required for sulfatase activity
MNVRARWGLGAVGGLALVAGVAAFARSRAEPPARCAPGMVAIGPRCCGEGQHLEGDRCAGVPSRCAAGMEASPAGCVAHARVVRLLGGTLRVGPGDWEAQGVVAPRQVEVAPFGIDALEVTESAWSACTAAGACPVVGLTGEPGRALGGVTADEARAYCRWAGGALPTSDQLAFAAAGSAARRYAWGDTGAVCRRAAWGLEAGPCAWGAHGPELAGSHPDGASPEGVLDLAGNVAEWAASTIPLTDGGQGSTEAETEVRGGSYATASASALRAWNRRVLPPGTRVSDVGFRCAYR